jgi:hypothetical protein
VAGYNNITDLASSSSVSPPCPPAELAVQELAELRLQVDLLRRTVAAHEKDAVDKAARLADLEAKVATLKELHSSELADSAKLRTYIALQNRELAICKQHSGRLLRSFGCVDVAFRLHKSDFSPPLSYSSMERIM